MQFVNKTTGQDVSSHVLQLLQKKITTDQFEAMTGLTKKV